EKARHHLRSEQFQALHRLLKREVRDAREQLVMSESGDRAQALEALSHNIGGANHGQAEFLGEIERIQVEVVIRKFNSATYLILSIAPDLLLVGRLRPTLRHAGTAVADRLLHRA